MKDGEVVDAGGDITTTANNERNETSPVHSKCLNLGHHSARVNVAVTNENFIKCWWLFVPELKPQTSTGLIEVEVGSEGARHVQ